MSAGPAAAVERLEMSSETPVETAGGVSPPSSATLPLRVDSLDMVEEPLRRLYLADGSGFRLVDADEGRRLQRVALAAARDRKSRSHSASRVAVMRR
jgi:hypothetical protein